MVLSLQILCIRTIQLNLIAFGANDRKLSLKLFENLSDDVIEYILNHNVYNKKLPLNLLSYVSNCELSSVDFYKIFDIDEINMDSFIRTILPISFPLLNTICIRNCNNINLTDYGISYLQLHYDNLISIDFSDCLGLTQNCLKCFQNMNQLEILNIENCNMKINKWFDIPLLHTLYIGGNQLTNITIEEICSQKFLEVLSINDYKSQLIDTTDKEVYHPISFSSAKNLKRLDLRFAMIEFDCIIEIFSQFLLLETLDISNTLLNDNITTAICQLNHIVSLSLNNTKITYNSLNIICFSFINTLKQLSLANCNLINTNNSNNTNKEEYFWTFSNLNELKELDLHNSTIQINSIHTNYFQNNNNFQLFPKSLIYLNINNCMNLLNYSIILTKSIEFLIKLNVLNLQFLSFSIPNWIIILSNKHR